MPKLHLITYGCQMNEYDSERVAGLLKREHYELTEVAEEADLVLLNTCAIREKAEDKVFSRLGQLGVLKRQRPDLLIGVMGCMAQLWQGKILDRAPHVDLVFGSAVVSRVGELVGDFTSVDLLAVEAGGPPDPGVLDPFSELLVDRERQRPNRGPSSQDEGFFEVGLLPRLLGVDPDAIQALKERASEILEARAVLGGDRMKREPRSGRVPREGRVRPIRIEIALVADRDRRLHQKKRRRARRQRPAFRPDPSPLQDREELLEAFFQLIGRDIQHEENSVGGMDQIREIRLRMVRRHGGRIHELNLHVFEGHHSRQGDARGEWICRHFRVGVGQCPHERRLPGVRRSDQDPLSGTLAPHVPGVEALGSGAPRVLPFLFELGDAVSQIRLDLLGPLVLRKERQHLAERLELLAVRGCVAESLLRLLVLRGQVRWHGSPLFVEAGSERLYTRRRVLRDGRASPGRPGRIRASCARMRRPVQEGQ